MPAPWSPLSTMNGVLAFRRSHTFMYGKRLSSQATAIWVGLSGCHVSDVNFVLRNHITTRRY